MLLRLAGTGLPHTQAGLRPAVQGLMGTACLCPHLQIEAWLLFTPAGHISHCDARAEPHWHSEYRGEKKLLLVVLRSSFVRKAMLERSSSFSLTPQVGARTRAGQGQKRQETRASSWFLTEMADPSSTACSGSRVEQPGLEHIPTWDASLSGSGSTHCSTVLPLEIVLTRQSSKVRHCSCRA